MADSMQVRIAASSSAHPRAFPAIVVGGLIVGAVDIVYAVAVYSPRHSYDQLAAERAMVELERLQEGGKGIWRTEYCETKPTNLLVSAAA